MIKPYMSISEYTIRPDLPVPIDVIDKIHKYHAWPVSFVRDKLGCPIFVSQNSGYRPEEHERSKGRGLTSEHLFKKLDRDGSEGYGAADYTTILTEMTKLIALMSEMTKYTRICLYPNVNTPFIHCDYRYYGSDTLFYVSKNNSWTKLPKNEILSIL